MPESSCLSNAPGPSCPSGPSDTRAPAAGPIHGADGAHGGVWSVYLVRCADNTLYCGVTRDLARRLRQHNGEIAGGARYTRARRPVTLVLARDFPTRSEAQRVEARVKKARAEKRLALLADLAHVTTRKDMSPGT